MILRTTMRANPNGPDLAQDGLKSQSLSLHINAESLTNKQKIARLALALHDSVLWTPARVTYTLVMIRKDFPELYDEVVNAAKVTVAAQIQLQEDTVFSLRQTYSAACDDLEERRRNSDLLNREASAERPID